MVESTAAVEYVFPLEWRKIKHDSQEYVYVKVLGKGGCGVVCEFKQPMTNHRLAVKIETLTSA